MTYTYATQDVVEAEYERLLQIAQRLLKDEEIYVELETRTSPTDVWTLVRRLRAQGMAATAYTENIGGRQMFILGHFGLPVVIIKRPPPFYGSDPELLSAAIRALPLMPQKQALDEWITWKEERRLDLAQRHRRHWGRKR
jgi:hypothetical protein